MALGFGPSYVYQMPLCVLTPAPSRIRFEGLRLKVQDHGWLWLGESVTAWLLYYSQVGLLPVTVHNC
jgi:hypothetical protein